MPDQTIPSFSGVNLRDESTKLDTATKCPLRRANGAYLLPRGSLSRPPVYERLWGMGNLRTCMQQLGLTAASGTALLLIRNEGELYLAFYDCANRQNLGGFYAGLDPESEFHGMSTLTSPNPTVQLLWTGLAPQTKWDGQHFGNLTVMGNGIDPNLTFESNTLTIRKMGDSVRPLPPIIAAVDASLSAPQDAVLQANNITFRALEPYFRPLHDPPYRRDRGNFVQVSVVRSEYGTFSSEVSGIGTAYDPFVYIVFAPAAIPTEDEVVNFVKRDPNASGIVSAFLTGEPGPARFFPPTNLAGGVAEFLPTDVFQGPHVAVCVTYVEKLGGDYVRETMPSPVVTCPLGTGFRAAVTVVQDTVSAVAAQYSAMRIYVADVGAAAFGLSPEYYGSFYRCLEVPNVNGTFEISPSMMQANNILSTEARIPLPCSMFIFANNQIYMSGNPQFPMRTWFTKQLTAYEPMPEGLGIYDYKDWPASVSDDAVVALGQYRGLAVAYTKANAYAIETTASTAYRFALRFGAVNSRTVLNYTNGVQYFLGRDYNIYTLNQPITDDKADLPDLNLPFPQIADYIQRFCDTTDTRFANGILDALNKNWWLWLRGINGNMQAFCIDMENGEVTGPFDFPQFISVTYFQPGNTKIVGQDMSGNLFFVDLAQQTTLSEVYTNDSGLTLHAGTEAADPLLDGFGIVVVPSATGGAPSFVTKAQVIRAQTPWLNFGAADEKKAFYSVQCELVEGSAGLLAIVAQNERRQQVYRFVGEVYGRRQPIRVLLRAAGAMLQFLVIVIVADDKPFSLRNITVQFEPMGQF